MYFLRRFAVATLWVALLAPPVLPAAADDPRCGCGAREGRCCCSLTKAAGASCSLSGASCGMARPIDAGRKGGLLAREGLRPAAAIASAPVAPPELPGGRLADEPIGSPRDSARPPDLPPPRTSVG